MGYQYIPLPMNFITVMPHHISLSIGALSETDVGDHSSPFHVARERQTGGYASLKAKIYL